MEEIAIYNNTNRFKLALNSQKVMEMPVNDAIAEIIAILGTTYFETGQTPESEQVLKLLANSLFNEVQTYFSTLTIAEVKLCFQKGCRKEYGDFYGLNVSTFHGWMKNYSQSQARMNAKKETQKTPELPVSKTEIEEMWRKATVRQFEEFKKTGVLNVHMPGMLYDKLEELGLITLSKAEKVKIYEQATEAVKQELQAKRLKVKPIQKQQIALILDRMAKNTPASTDQSLIKTKAKEIAIKNYYSSITTLNL